MPWTLLLALAIGVVGPAPKLNAATPESRLDPPSKCSRVEGGSPPAVVVVDDRVLGESSGDLEMPADVKSIDTSCFDPATGQLGDGIGHPVVLALTEEGWRRSADEMRSRQTRALVEWFEASRPRPESAFEDPPEWAQDAVWYQIFPERFHNGDPTNDPTAEDIVGGYPDVVPDGWSTTPWTQDWYRHDPWFGELETMRDNYGNLMTSFDARTQLRRYGGDLQGVLDKLDYLADLGVTAIYFNPLNDSPSLHKYDARNWRHIDRNFGPTPQRDLEIMASEDPTDPATWRMTGADSLFVEVIAAMHERGMRVILDFSWNHTGQTFWAWKDVLENQADSEFADWYWVQSFDDPATGEDEFAYRGWFGVKTLPEIRETTYVDHAERIEPFEGEFYSQEAEDHVLAVTRRWMDPDGDGDPSDGVDGFRLDVAAEVPFGFWRTYRNFVRSINPEAYLLGEIWWERFPNELLDPEPFLRGDVFDAVMNYRWYRAARHFFAAAPDPMAPSEFVRQLEELRASVRPVNDAAMMNVTASHDTPRLATSLFNPTGYKLDAKAEQNPEYRIHRPDAAIRATQRLLLTHQFTWVGAPQIWAGDEMGMWGTDDPHTRKPLIWPELDFEDEAGHPLGLERPRDPVRFDAELFAFYQRLIALRNDNPALRRGEVDVFLVDDEAGRLGYRRVQGPESAVALFNLSASAQEFVVPAAGDDAWEDALGGAEVVREGSRLRLTLPGRASAVLLPR